MKLNNEINIVEKAITENEENVFLFGQDQHREFTPKRIFIELQSDIENTYNTSKFNIKGRVMTIFPQLERYGISTFEEFEKECALVLIKKSELPSTIRNTILRLYQIIKYRYNEKIKNL